MAEVKDSATPRLDLPAGLVGLGAGLVAVVGSLLPWFQVGIGLSTRSFSPSGYEIGIETLAAGGVLLLLGGLMFVPRGRSLFGVVCFVAAAVLVGDVVLFFAREKALARFISGQSALVDLSTGPGPYLLSLGAAAGFAAGVIAIWRTLRGLAASLLGVAGLCVLAAAGFLGVRLDGTGLFSPTTSTRQVAQVTPTTASSLSEQAQDDAGTGDQDASVVQTGCAALDQLSQEIAGATAADIDPIQAAMDPSPGSPWSQVTAMETVTESKYSGLASGTRYLIQAFSSAIAQGDPTPAQVAVADLTDNCTSPG